jgi:DNA polymerase III epsilon subunit-like protein
MNRNDRLTAAHWAQTILTLQPVILDTETTGTSIDDEIVQIALIDHEGNPLLDTLVKPVKRIPLEVTQIHGIDNAQVQDAPAWDDIAPDVIKLLAGQSLIIYNADFDLRLMRQSCRSKSMRTMFTDLDKYMPVFCAMLKYAQFWGDWNDFRQDYRWQGLGTACVQQHIHVPDARAHSALGDCLRTISLVKAMAAYAEKEEVQS